MSKLCLLWEWQFATLKILFFGSLMKIRRCQHCTFVLCFNKFFKTFLCHNYIYQLIQFNTNCTSHYFWHCLVTSRPCHRKWSKNCTLHSARFYRQSHSMLSSLLLPWKACEGGSFWHTLSCFYFSIMN